MKKFSMMMAMLLIVSFCFATWLSVEESVVTLPPGESVTVNLTANGANLAPGNYELPLTVITNDPELEIVEIPATATIFTKPKIASVVDVPNDQGGWVFVEFYRCFYDDTPLNDDRSAEVYTIEMNNGDGWIAVGTLSAYAENSYSALIPTTTDATETNEALFDFRIIAAMDEGNWVSDVVQGFSVDNIVPAPPVNLLSNAMHESVEIKWDIPVEDDYQYSKIYQNDVLVGTTAELSFVDNNVLANSEYIYTVKHVDANGNVGESTVLTTRTLAWSIQLSIEDNNFVLGTANEASVLFDDGFDIPLPPSPPTDFVEIYAHHPEWNFVLGDKFMQDVQGIVELADDMQVWEIHLLSDNDGDVAVNFDFSAEVPALPAFIYDESLSYKVALTDAMTHTFTLVANTEAVFYLAIGDNTAPVNAVTYPNGLEFLQSGEEATFTFDVTDGYSVDENVVSISYDGVEYSEVGVATENSITFTPENALSNSCYLKVISTDFAENFSEDVSDYEFTVVGNELANNLNVGWHLWSSALAFENTLAEQIADDYEGAFYPYAWTDGGYLVPENITTGQSIWLGFMEDAEFDIVGVPYLAEQEIAMELGWNLIANPLVREVDKSMLIVVVDEVEYTFADAVTNGFIENSVYGFNVDEYINVDALSYANGYWFGSFVDGVTVRFAPHQTVVARETVEREYLWQVEINNLNIAGMENTNPAWDVNDAPLPPATPLGFVADMYITHPEWNNPLGNNFNSDIRPVADLTDAQTYELVITTPQTLTWTLTDIDAEIEVILTIDDVDYDLKVIDELVVESCNATLVIGDVLDANENEIAVVTRLNGNYPNPFNPTTTISFSLTADNAKNAEIEIFNIKGQKVETHQITNSPNQQIVWNADNHASGVYFYKLIVDGKPVDTRKMILLK